MICTMMKAHQIARQAEQATRNDTKATKRVLLRLLKEDGFAAFDNCFDSDEIDISVMNTDKTVTRIRRKNGWTVNVEC